MISKTMGWLRKLTQTTRTHIARFLKPQDYLLSIKLQDQLNSALIRLNESVQEQVDQQREYAANLAKPRNVLHQENAALQVEVLELRTRVAELERQLNRPRRDAA